MVACTFCVALLAGCYKWVPVPPDTALRAIEEQEMGRAIITAESGAEYDVRSPWVRGDTIMWADREGRGSIPCSDVRYVDRRELEAGKTVGLVAVIGASIVATLFALAAGGAG